MPRRLCDYVDCVVLGMLSTLGKNEAEGMNWILGERSGGDIVLLYLHVPLCSLKCPNYPLDQLIHVSDALQFPL